MATSARVLEHPNTTLPAPRRRGLAGRFPAPLAVAVVFGLLAFVAFLVVTGRGERARVAVAARDLGPGEVVDAAALRYVELDATEPVLATLVTPEAAAGLAGHVAAGDLHAGEVVSRSDLVAPAADQGRRAMSLAVDRAHAVAGALRRGDRVDVVATRDGAARFLVTGAEVLSVEDRAGGVAAATSFSITLAVDAEQALALASAMGSRNDGLEVVRATGAAPPTVESYDPRAGVAAAPPGAPELAGRP